MTSELRVSTIAAVGGTSAMTIDSSGRVAQPQLPFSYMNVFRNATSTNGHITFPTVITNQGNHWNTSGVFLAQLLELINFNLYWNESLGHNSGSLGNVDIFFYLIWMQKTQTDLFLFLWWFQEHCQLNLFWHLL